MTCRLRLAALVLLTALGLAAAPAQARTPPSFFGVIVDGPVLAPPVDLAAQAARIRATGIRSIRVAVYWSDAQPYATPADVPPGEVARYPVLDGVPTDLAELDRIVAAAAAQGLTVLPVVQRSPRWAASGPEIGAPPVGTASYARFLTTLVGRYGPKGAFWTANRTLPKVPIRRWQVWNEPDITKFWSGSPWAPGYVTLLKGASKALKAADPHAQVVAAGLTNKSWLDLRRLYAAGARGAFDVAAIHPFSRRVSDVVRIVRLARREMRRAGDPRKPLLLSEVSWSSGLGHSTFNYGWETSELGQAARVRAALTALARERQSLGILGLYWYTWGSPAPTGPNSFDYSGLLDQGPDGALQAKPALAAYRSTVAALTR